MAFRNVISTLSANGEEVMGPNILLWHYPNNDIMNQSLLTVESNHFCVLKSRGAIINVYETGQYPVETPQKVLFGAFQQAFYGGQSPWQYEAMYINRAKLVATKEDAVKLVQHMPYRGHVLTNDDVNVYAGPVVEQAINQVVQVTPLEQVNERIHDITELVHSHLQEFLAGYGITLDTVKVLVHPRDERMKALISLKAFGLTEIEAVRYYTAMIMAERGVVSAPNMAAGVPYHVGGALPTVAIDRIASAVSAPQISPNQGQHMSPNQGQH